MLYSSSDAAPKLLYKLTPFIHLPYWSHLNDVYRARYYHIPNKLSLHDFLLRSMTKISCNSMADWKKHERDALKDSSSFLLFLKKEKKNCELVSFFNNFPWIFNICVITCFLESASWSEESFKACRTSQDKLHVFSYRASVENIPTFL